MQDSGAREIRDCAGESFGELLNKSGIKIQVKVIPDLRDSETEAQRPTKEMWTGGGDAAPFN